MLNEEKVPAPQPAAPIVELPPDNKSINLRPRSHRIPGDGKELPPQAGPLANVAGERKSNDRQNGVRPLVTFIANLHAQNRAPAIIRPTAVPATLYYGRPSAIVVRALPEERKEYKPPHP